jgi:hypothetical protein
MASGFDQLAPAGYAWAVSESDTVDFPMVARALYIGTGGDVVLLAYNTNGQQSAVTFKNVPDGAILPVRTSRVTTATSAGDIVALA